MKNKIIKIAKDLEQGTVTTEQAQTLLLGLLGVIKSLIMFDLNEFIEIIGNNIKSIEYDTELDRWLIKYKNELNDDNVNSDDLLEFLENA